MRNSLPRICFVAPNAFPLLVGDQSTEVVGGAELQQVLVAKGLVKRGYDVSMICLDFGQEVRVEVDGIKVIRAYKPNAGVPILRFIWPRLAAIWRSMADADADIYYQRSAGALTGIVVEFCRQNHRKSIFAAAGNPDLELKTSRIRLARDRWIFERGLRHVDCIAVQNDEQARLCHLNYGLDATLIPNCYPFSGGRTDSGDGYVLWVSTIRKLKRPELFLDLAVALPDLRFRMVGGPGAREGALFNSIKARAEAIPNLEFMGFAPYAMTESYFDLAALFVNTSESEGFPNTFLQAWARGVPTVSFVDCGSRMGGLPVGKQVETVEEMAAYVARMLEDEPKRARIGARCREYFEAHHTLERVLNIYENVLSKVALSKAK